MTTNGDIEGWGVANDLFNGYYRENPNVYSLQLKSHRASAKAIPNARTVPIISAINYITSLFVKFRPNCCQNHDRESDHNYST